MAKDCAFEMLSKSSWIDVKKNINLGGYFYGKLKGNDIVIDDGASLFV